MKLADAFSILNATFGFLAIYYRDPSFIFLAAFADGLDGYLARKYGSGDLGKNLDTLADFISFGVAPAYFLGIFAFPYLLASIYRLARFLNVNKEDFVGFPVTASAMIVVPLLFFSKNLSLFAAIILSFFMVSEIEYKKVKDAKLLSVAAILILIAFIDSRLSVGILTLSILYLLSPLAKNFYKH
ncbi:CDP-diacylglycerol/serine O-phosphatidyltransferase [Ferroglobus placidus DSM 10642]|uniref:CDP-diacylglycerol/serine O-phosphatidyltransferase n=1 Tax=Ferroglobus placidus (strain DSM 10642 / AEDII12DO) TaxID=589924 RepID=D3RYJ7_FERPA|nr:CDP-alcohol phosphatidyltransferase family protein [Ferroglobus placidus]ADC65560.1 CDP-diacylglycerol/serine O-phosphatidyltransferase [Ferroglobus placidus DSM 10642]